MEKNQFIEIDGLVYDFNPYDNYEEYGNYLGFIDPEGYYYRVRKIYDIESERPHNTWAKNFMLYHNLSCQDETLTFSLVLVKEYGFILCSYKPSSFFSKSARTFLIPELDGICNYELCDKYLTNEKQLETIHQIKELEEKHKKKRNR